MPLHDRFTNAYKAGAYEDAASLLSRIAAISPQYAGVHYNLGIIHGEHLQQYVEAAGSYRRACSLDPFHFNAHVNLGVMLYHLKQYEEAVVYYRKASAIDPAHLIPHENVGVVLRRILKRYEEAGLAGRRALALAPQDRDLNHHLVETLCLAFPSTRGTAIEEAEAEGALRRELIQLGGRYGDRSAWGMLAKYDMILRDPSMAVRTLDKLLQAIVSPDAAGAVYRDKLSNSALQAWVNAHPPQCFNLEDRLSNKIQLHRALILGDLYSIGLAPKSFDLTDEKERSAFMLEYHHQHQQQQAKQDENEEEIRWLLRTQDGFRGKGTWLLGQTSSPPLEEFFGLVSEVIEYPLLLNGRKTELRVHVVVESITPVLKVHVYESHFKTAVSNLQHQKRNDLPIEEQGMMTHVDHGRGGTAKEVLPEVLLKLVTAAGGTWSNIWADILDLVRKTILAAVEALRQDAVLSALEQHATPSPCEWAYFSFDILLAYDAIYSNKNGSSSGRRKRRGSNLRPILIEVNGHRSNMFTESHLYPEIAQRVGQFGRDLFEWLKVQARRRDTEGGTPLGKPGSGGGVGGRNQGHDGETYDTGADLSAFGFKQVLPWDGTVGIKYRQGDVKCGDDAGSDTAGAGTGAGTGSKSGGVLLE